MCTCRSLKPQAFQGGRENDGKAPKYLQPLDNTANSPVRSSGSAISPFHASPQNAIPFMDDGYGAEGVNLPELGMQRSRYVIQQSMHSVDVSGSTTVR